MPTASISAGDLLIARCRKLDIRSGRVSPELEYRRVREDGARMEKPLVRALLFLQMTNDAWYATLS